MRYTKISQRSSYIRSTSFQVEQQRKPIRSRDFGCSALGTLHCPLLAPTDCQLGGSLKTNLDEPTANTTYNQISRRTLDLGQFIQKRWILKIFAMVTMILTISGKFGTNMVSFSFPFDKWGKKTWLLFSLYVKVPFGLITTLTRSSVSLQNRKDVRITSQMVQCHAYHCKFESSNFPPLKIDAVIMYSREHE